MGVLLQIVKKNAAYEFSDEITCPICRKKFIPAPQHYWKIGNWDGITGERIERVCSYTCMRKWEKEQEAYDKRKNKRHHSKYEYKL